MERIGEDDLKEEQFFRDLWEDETQREEEVENAGRDPMKYEMETTRGYYRNALTGYSEDSEYLLVRALRMTSEPLGEVR